MNVLQIRARMVPLAKTESALSIVNVNKTMTDRYVNQVIQIFHNSRLLRRIQQLMNSVNHSGEAQLSFVYLQPVHQQVKLSRHHLTGLLENNRPTTGTSTSQTVSHFKRGTAFQTGLTSSSSLNMLKVH